ncbi:hypothetical protein GT370_02050 [Acidocella sp. MX-AZ03]|uniref:hypothetical protein n=1 Tax=Acidocella sp. MX-AZ03 TaxID=2697363 RepID=UPI0022DE86CC|nr:hypothetical protein [Acidocella sp. MX-AZ03]WBO59721.1 hypothetical protein GT370_02050 [Acidocella sp. MX-AZ03]
MLLKGVNDSEDALAALFRAMLRARVKPYYLHQLDPAPAPRAFMWNRRVGGRFWRRCGAGSAGRRFRPIFSIGLGAGEDSALGVAPPVPPPGRLWELFEKSSHTLKNFCPLNRKLPI